jgi:hypothetical protein
MELKYFNPIGDNVVVRSLNNINLFYIEFEIEPDILMPHLTNSRLSQVQKYIIKLRNLPPKKDKLHVYFNCMSLTMLLQNIEGSLNDFSMILKSLHDPLMII